ncbi:MAG: Gfo/Idh/MocA family oxidoreductase [Candidatus Methylomirabilis oxygeniifera]|uniref:Oxidoreductase domain protein n=1 Tax=Methylomirabilis oxygeniifera TaxID=671143 RepID=D5MMB0_METO1|nr:MAG: Gfo/Idh/MocA family oxidoreductase [Candidatus Methylomirabilis oxyfera]CBE67996.1 Oxidoreductase domain protein [Candidatus Methylomirabilis oxyfera]
MNVAIVGCGLIGRKRAMALTGCRLVACADVVVEHAEALARTIPGTQPMTDWRALVERQDVDAVIVSTTHNALADITLAAVLAGKHVLVEKPAAHHAAELDPVIDAAERAQILVRVGFNHRYHPALRQAKALAETGAIGELLYVRGRYGHGGRLGYEKEWRADPALSGGGELIDQGVHLVDLARWFLGDFTDVHGFAQTYYWDMPVEDNGFMLLRTAKQQVAMLHASWTEWKNLFSFEIFGRQGKLEITGLGGSYGTERLTHYRMLPDMGPPETTIWEYPRADTSWDGEFTEFVEDIRCGRQPAASLADARAALDIVQRIYAASGV